MYTDLTMSRVLVRESALTAELGDVDNCTFCDIAQGEERSLFDRAQFLEDGITYLVPTAA